MDDKVLQEELKNTPSMKGLELASKVSTQVYTLERKRTLI
jgi:hypothetical protein